MMTKTSCGVLLSFFCILAILPALNGCGGEEGLVESSAVLNFPPTAEAGPDRTVLPGEEVLLDGSASSDRNGDSLSFFWRFISRPTGSSAVLSDPAAIMPAFIADAGGNYVLELAVNDGQNEDNDLVTIRAAEPEENLPPEADAGLDRTVRTGVPLLLDGRQSSDPEGDLLRYSWEIISHPGDSLAVISGPLTSTPVLVPDAVGEFALDLVVRDSLGASATDRIVLTAVPGSPPPAGNREPLANAAPDRLVPTGALVTIDGGESFDPDGDELFFFWSLIEKPAQSETSLVDPAGSIAIFRADAAGDYHLQLTVTDGFATSDPDFAIVTSSPSPPDGMGLYDSLCSVCHSLGLHDPLGAPELSGQGELLPLVFDPVHKERVLSPGEILALRDFIDFQ